GATCALRPEHTWIAERVLDARGGPPWPACSARLGLDKSDARGEPSKHPDGKTAAERRVDSNREDNQSASRGKHRKAHHRTHAVYVVRSGDTLSGIASKKHVSGGWMHL